MAQKKLIRFAQIKTFPNVFENPTNIKGTWNFIFKNNNPIILELGCGRGEYTIGLSQIYPDKNFIGIDIKGNRMYIGAKKALEGNLNNVAFLRSQIEKLPEYFTQGEIEAIWITFPDPYLRVSKSKKRLTHPRFLRLYQQVLKQGGSLHLKTDSPEIFRFTNTVINLFNLTKITESDDVYLKTPLTPELEIKTHYENLDIAQSRKIYYLEFIIPAELSFADEELKELLKNES